MRGETGFWRVLGGRGRQCSVKVNPVLLGTKEAVFANWSVSIPSSPVPASISHLQLPVSGKAVLGKEQASVLVTPLRACLAHSASGQPPMAWPQDCALLCLIALYLYL